MANRWRELAPGLCVAALLILAMAGVFAYERGQFGEYPIEWSESSEVPEDSADSRLTEGRTENHAFAIQSEGVARTTVRLTWPDDVGQPDTFRLEVRGPNQLAGGPVRATGGTLELVVPASASGASVPDGDARGDMLPDVAGPEGQG